MAKSKTPPARSYVLVQHSGWTHGHNPQMMYGVEVEEVSAAKGKSLAAKGVRVYAGYVEATAAEEAAMYPKGYGGLIPVANRVGTFLNIKVAGAAVFKHNEEPQNG
jgi:hypothetical protein